MKITKTYSWHRRDFCYDAKCENCNHETKDNSGYDDSNYYNNVIPNWKCPKCGESSNSLGTKVEVAPKYNPNIIM
jgi:Zn finger protein HypA/HybF involved in hydrogenase expression